VLTIRPNISERRIAYAAVVLGSRFGGRLQNYTYTAYMVSENGNATSIFVHL